MTLLEQLSGDFDKILNYAIRQDLAAFLAKALAEDPNPYLPYALKAKRAKNPNKSHHVRSWKELDLAELLEVIDDKYQSLTVGEKCREAKRAIERMRDLRNEVAHRMGDVDLHGLYVDTNLLERFATFIQTPPVTIEVITTLRQGLQAELERVAGIRSQPIAPTPQAALPTFFQPSGNPFEKFERLLAIHDEFVGRTKIIVTIRDFITAHNSGTLILEAEPGTGKSALIAHCIRHGVADIDMTLRPAYYLYHCSEGLTDSSDCLRTLYSQLVKTHGIEQAEALGTAETASDLGSAFHRLLTTYVAPRLGEHKQLIFIDSLDEARTDTELTAYQALPDQLPKGIFVIASTRSIPERIKVLTRREHIQRLNLNLPDFNPDNLRDAREFVASRLNDKSIDQSTQDEICRLGAGNFLVLREICRWVREKLLPEDRDGFLKRLAAEPDGPLRAIYDEFWGRIPKANLDAASGVAGLILEAHGPATDALALESGVVGRSGWETGIEQLAEYLRQINADDGRPSFRVYHQSFADFLQMRVDWESQRARQALAKMCLRWRDLQGELRRYAVAFGPGHLCRADKWPELETLLTDLEFVEEKCRLGMVRGLISDYEQASQQVPEWSDVLREEATREESLKDWAAKVMVKGRKWRDDLDRIWAGDDPDAIKLPYQLPIPPDTSMLREQLLEVSQGNARRLNKRIENLQVLRAFVTQRAELLQSNPNSTLPLAFNFSEVLADQAERIIEAHGTPWFEERPRPYFDPCVIPTPTLRVNATAFAISDDGQRCVTGESNGDLRFWDLTTGKCIAHEPQAHEDEVTRILLSVDGSRVISFGKSGSIEARHFHDQSEHWRDSQSGLPHVTAAACSWEGSIIATVDSEDEVRVVDGDTGELLCELHDPEVQGIASIHVVPERFQILVEYEEGMLAAWDLRTVVSTATEPYESEEMELPEGEASDQDVDDLADFWHRGSESADRRIAVRSTVYPDDDDGNQIYADGERTTKVWFYNNSGTFLVANGRVLWVNTRDPHLELMKTEFPEKNFDFFKSRICAWDVLSQVSGEDVETAPLESKGGEPARTMRGDSETTELPGRRLFIVIEEDGVTVCDHKTGECLRRFRVSGKVRLALVTPDARFLVCYCDENVQVFDLRPGQQSEEPLLVQPCLNILSGFSGARIDRDGAIVIDGPGSTGHLPSIGDSLDMDVRLKLRNLP